MRTACALILALESSAVLCGGLPLNSTPSVRVTTEEHLELSPPEAVRVAWKHAAMFNRPVPTTLRLAVHGRGVIDQTPWSCYTNAAQVRLTARPLKGWHFAKWTGAVDARYQTNNPAIVVFEADSGIQVIMAVFDQNPTAAPDAPKRDAPPPEEQPPAP